MKKLAYTITVLDPAGTSVQKRAMAATPELAAARGVELAKRTSQLSMADRRYGVWKATAVME